MPAGLAAQLIPSQTRVAPGSRLEYVVLNTGSIAIAFGRPHRLERLRGEEWEALPVEPGSRRLVYTAAPAHARQLKLRIPRQLQDGRYRLTLRVREAARRSDPKIFGGPRPREAAREAEISFEFEVAAGD